MMWPSVRFPVLLLVGGVLAGGCTAEGSVTGTRTMAEYAAAYDAFPAERYYAQAQARQEEKVAECMRAEGFDYTPYDPAKAEGVGPTLDPEMTAEQYRATYGYGITAAPGDAAPPGQSTWTDPRAPQDGAASQAYSEALMGTVVDGQERSWDGAADPGPDAGCLDRAMWAVQQEADPELALYMNLMDEYQAKIRRLADAPELAGARSDWSACMAEAGHPDIPGPGQAPEYVSDRVLGGSGPAASAGGDGGAEGDPTDGTEAADPVSGTAHDFEMAVVRADDACRASTGWEAALAEVRAPVDADFAARHRAELEAMVVYLARPEPTW